MDLFLGIDIGTSATKGLLINAAGRVLGSASGSYPLRQPKPGWSEQDPADWWHAVVNVVRTLLDQTGRNSGAIRAVGLSGQMHGSVFLDAPALAGGGQPMALRPALLWNDQRTAGECAEIETLFGGRRATVELVGNAALTGFTLPKVLWVRRHEPEIFRRTAGVLLPKDFVRLCLTGGAWSDVGDASGTLLLDVGSRAWSRRAFELTGLDPSLFPPLVESGAVAGTVSARAAAETGLVAGTPVVGGSGDNQCGAVGAGVVEAGDVLATLGTSGVIYAHAAAPRKDLPPPPAPPGRLHTMCAATGDGSRAGAWCVTGVMLSAAGSLRWARDTLFPGESFESLVAGASAVAPGCEGLVFLPYLTGERCPYPDPTARGGWIGLTARHTRAQLVRAVIEGVTFGMGQILDLVRATGVGVSRVRVGGGGAQSPLWRQVQADVYGTPVVTTAVDEGPAYGAALLAGVGAGAWANIAEACRRTVQISEETLPSGDRDAYEIPRRVYSRLYADLKPAMGLCSATG